MSYQKEKASLKRLVTQWQKLCRESTVSFKEIKYAGARFHQLGKRLGLTRWLEERGIPRLVEVDILEKVDTNNHKCDII